MPRLLDTRQDLSCYAVSARDDLDLPALMATMDEAWQADYQDQERLAFDETHLHWLMQEPFWIGVLLCTPAGRPVGFEMALERTLYCQQQPLRAYYATTFTVSSSYRRRGLGRWLLESLNHLVFAERGADLIFSTFHLGHAGSPTVQATFAQIPGWDVVRFHTTPIWGRRLDRHPLPPLSSPVSASRIVLAPDGSRLLPAAALAPFALPSTATLTAALHSAYAVAFGLAASFGALYLQELPHSGTFWYTFGPEAFCCLSFHMATLQVNARRLGRLGQVQSVHAVRCQPAQLRLALHHLCTFFHEQGCFAATVLDQGVLPAAVLQALGFRPSEERLVFAVRGPRVATAPFATVQPPYFLDFI